MYQCAPSSQTGSEWCQKMFENVYVIQWNCSSVVYKFVLDLNFKSNVNYFSTSLTFVCEF